MKKLFIYTLVAAALILAGCSNMRDFSGGTTGLRITVQGEGAGARTLYPNTVFTKYVLKFSGPSDREDITLESGKISVNVDDLAEGTWKITAVGYVTIGGVEYPAAEGSIQETVVSGESKDINITVSASKEGPPGFFYYNIQFPSDVVEDAGLYIYRFGTDEAECSPLDLKTKNEDTIQLSPGYYMMKIRLSYDSSSRTAGRTEIVHIYSNMETRAEYTFENSDFTAEMTVDGSDLAAKLAWVKANARSNTRYSIKVTVAESIVPHILSYEGKENIAIKLIGDDPTRSVSLSSTGSIFTVGNGVTLELGVTLKGHDVNNTALVYVNSGGTLIMKAGSAITGNTGGGVGGGVWVDGTFTMDGGTISHNTSTNGGGVAVNTGGTFTMNIGEISNNIASHYGGGVHVNGTFTMNGGIILDNTAASSSGGGGGGVFVNNGGTFTMIGGEIKENNSNVKNSGGVYASESSTLKLGGDARILDNYMIDNGSNIDDNVYLISGSHIILGNDSNGAPTPVPGMEIWGRTTNADGVIVKSGATVNDPQYFYADDRSKVVVLEKSGGNDQLVLKTATTTPELTFASIYSPDNITIIAYRVSGFSAPAGDVAVYIPAYYRVSETSSYLPVTTIGTSALNSANIIAVTIPATVTIIDTGAFSNCTNIRDITIPASVTTIRLNAFQQCGNLISVTFATGSNIDNIDFQDLAFPQGSGTGNNLRTAYFAADGSGGAGTYVRDPGGTDWRKVP